MHSTFEMQKVLLGRRKNCTQIVSSFCIHNNVLGKAINFQIEVIVPRLFILLTCIIIGLRGSVIFHLKCLATGNISSQLQRSKKF